MLEIKLRGFDQARAALRAMPDRIQKNVLRGAVVHVATMTATHARSLAPVETGNLLDNVVHARGRGRRGQVKAGVIVREQGKADSGKNAFYWRFLEFGTVKMAAKPFLRPAFDALAARLSSIIASYLPRRVEKELRKLAGMPRR